MNDVSTLLNRTYRLKLVIVGGVLAFGGLVLSWASDWLASSTSSSHLLVAVLRTLSDVLLVTGAIGIAVDLFTGRDKEAADIERTRTVLQELTPAFTDAVLKGLAVGKSDLKRVASPELLDDLATNALSLRLGDDQFAREIYADVRDQAIGASERFYDVEVNVRLSTAADRSTQSAPRFDVLVEWEYSVAPSQAVRTFACTSDREVYRDLSSSSATSAWFMAPRPGLDASSRKSYELLYFGVDGREQKIRRQQRKDGQSYVVRLEDDLVNAGERVRLRHIYRTQTQADGHFLFLEVPQPSRDLHVSIDYGESDIAQLRVTDLLTSSRRTQILRMPDVTGERTVRVDHTGWVLPRAGVAIAWTLSSERAEVPAAPAASAA